MCLDLDGPVQIKELLHSYCYRRTSKRLPNCWCLSFPLCHCYFCLYWLNILAKRGCCGLARHDSLPSGNENDWKCVICYPFLALFDSNVYAGIYTFYPRNDHGKSIQLITLYTIHYVKLVNWLHCWVLQILRR